MGERLRYLCNRASRDEDSCKKGELINPELINMAPVPILSTGWITVKQQRKKKLRDGGILAKQISSRRKFWPYLIKQKFSAA